MSLGWRSKQNSPRIPPEIRPIGLPLTKKPSTRPNSSKKSYQWPRPSTAYDFRSEKHSCVCSVHSHTDQESKHYYTTESAELLKTLLREPWNSEESIKNDPWTAQEDFKSEEEKLDSDLDEKFKRLFPTLPEDPFSSQQNPNENELIDLTETLEPEKVDDENQTDSEKVLVSQRESTYDDLVQIIHEIEENPAVEEEKLEDVSNKQSPKDTLNEIMDYLTTIEINTESTKVQRPVSVQNFPPPSTIEEAVKLEDLLGRSGIELAQLVVSLRIQVDEQAGGLRLLQQTIFDLKMSLKEGKEKHRLEIEKINNDSEAALTRHQKMVKQILGEKKALNDKVASLVEELKTTEERHQRNLKAIEERHLIEIQRVKETQSAAEKLKREKWIDVKTQKIKEMTVKGLEPELSRMAARQQAELAELRNLHRAELEAVELRAARRTTELMDQLRTEMARDKEEALQRENAAQRMRWEKVFEEERGRHDDELKRLKDEIKREKDRQRTIENNLLESLNDAKREHEKDREREKNSVIREYEEKIDTIEKNHQGELKSLRESLEMEKDVWMNNFKKMQIAKFLEREAELHQQYKRERDRDIEMAIERLESEATQARLELTEASENRLRRVKDKFETDLKDLESEVNTYKNKLTEIKLILEKKEDALIELNTQHRHLQTEYTQLKKLCNEMSAQRMDLRKVVCVEFEDQIKTLNNVIEQLKGEMASLQAKHKGELSEKDHLIEKATEEARRELVVVYGRVKATINKKDEAIEVLREQYKVALERCSHLEHMLDTQRRNLLLN